MMNTEHNGSNIRLVHDGNVVAVADFETTDDPSVIRASLHTEAGHLPVGAAARLVDAVLDLDETRRRDTLEATLPLGEVEALERLRSRCARVQTRPAGATCLADAKLPSTPAARELPAPGTAGTPRAT
jgi:hypothetical protein